MFVNHPDQHVVHLDRVTAQSGNWQLRQPETVVHERGLDVLDPDLASYFLEAGAFITSFAKVDRIATLVFRMFECASI